MLRSPLRRVAGLTGAAALTVATVAVLGTPSYAEPSAYPTCRSAPADVEVLSIDYAKGTATVKLKTRASCEEAGITLASYQAQSNTWETSRPQYLYDSQTQIGLAARRPTTRSRCRTATGRSTCSSVDRSTPWSRAARPTAARGA